MSAHLSPMNDMRGHGVESDAPLPVLEQHDLLAAVRHARVAPIVRVLDWQVSPLSGGSEASSSVYHVTGHAWANDQQLCWDVVLKVIRPTVDRLDTEHWNYWKREAYAYRSGWLRWDAAGLAAPRCYDISERADGSTWLWLEALRDAVSRPWPITTYELVARQLGIFNGGHLAHSSHPNEGWVSQDWLRRYINECGAPLAHLPEL